MIVRVEKRGADWVVTDKVGGYLFRGTEDAAEAFKQGVELGFEVGEEEGREVIFDNYAVFDEEGNGPIISRRRMQKMCDGNAAFLAARDHEEANS